MINCSYISLKKYNFIVEYRNHIVSSIRHYHGINTLIIVTVCTYIV